MLVWNAMQSITGMISAICFELALMARMVSTTQPTTSPPRFATDEAPRDSLHRPASP